MVRLILQGVFITAFLGNVKAQHIDAKEEFLRSQSGSEIPFMDSTYTWTEYVEYYSWGMPGSLTFNYTIDNEPTIFGSNTYYAILRQDPQFPQYWTEVDYIRQENNIIYLRGIPDYQLFNFNLVVNDTFVSPWETLVVDSLDTMVLLTGEVRKHWKLRCIFNEHGAEYYTEWVEGIGNLNGQLSSNVACCFDCDSERILCVHRNDTLIYDDPEYDSCWLMPTATTELKNAHIYIAPNPATNEIELYGLEKEIKFLTIFNALGIPFYYGREKRINVQEFPCGYYYAVISMDDKSVVTAGFIKY